MEEQRVKLEKMATVGELATMVAHDLRNPLTSIRNASFYMKSTCGSLTGKGVQPLLEMTDLIEQEIIYANNIINDLLEFAAKRPLQREKHDLNKLLEGFFEQNKTPENIRLESNYRAKTPVNVDSRQMHRVFSNLTENAIQAMPEGGKLTVETRESEHAVDITFADTGVGIPEENMSRLFQPLFTTKAKGIGMGLAICKRIIEQHGGTITVQSKADRGAVFIMRMPKTESA